MLDNGINLPVRGTGVAQERIRLSEPQRIAEIAIDVTRCFRRGYWCLFAPLLAA